MDDLKLPNNEPHYDRDLGTRKTGMLGAATTAPGKHGSRARTPRGTMSRPQRRPDESLTAFAVRKAAHRAGAFNGGPVTCGAVRHVAQKALHGVKAAAAKAKQARHKAQGRSDSGSRSIDVQAQS